VLHCYRINRFQHATEKQQRFDYLGFVESATTDFIADSYCQRFTDSEVKAFCGLTNHWRISESQCVVYLFFLTWSTAQTPQTIVNAPIYIPWVARLYSSDYRPLGTVNFTHSHRASIYVRIISLSARCPFPRSHADYSGRTLVYHFNFTSFGSRRSRTSAEMGCLATRLPLCDGVTYAYPCAAKNRVAVLLMEQP